MRLLLICLFTLGCGIAEQGWASCEALARLVASDGQVSIKPSGKVLKVSPGALPRALCAGDEIHTFEGHALIDDGRAKVALAPYSVASFSAVGQAALQKGQALFDVRKRTVDAGMAVKTRLSVIGVKGTRFLVSDTRQQIGVVLDRGVVEIVSTQGPVGLFRERSGPKSTAEEFADFARQHAAGVAAEQADFERYKNQIQREFVAYVVSLTLQAGKELVTTGRIAVERDISRDSANALKSLAAWADRQ